MEWVPEITALFFIELFAVMMPGPDFAMITRNSLSFSRRAGVISSLGLGIGCLIHFTWACLGLDILLDEAPSLFILVRVLGALYLCYMGATILLQKKKKKTDVKDEEVSVEDFSIFKAFFVGLFTNLLNPKAIVFFISIISQMVTKDTPYWVLFTYAAIIFFTTFGWFAFLSMAISYKRVKQKLERLQRSIELAMAVVLIFFGVNIAFFF